MGASTVLPDLIGHSTAVKVVRSVDPVLGTGGAKSVINYTVQTRPAPVARPATPVAPAPAAVKNAPAAPSCPPAGPGHEYLVVWSGKMNAGDLTGKDALIFANGGAINPQAIRDVLPQETMPGQDMEVVIDAERGCGTYGNVVDIALIPGADGVENEPHHMQDMWFPGQPLWAGGVFSSRLFTWDPSALPKLTLMSTQEPFATPGGSIWTPSRPFPTGPRTPRIRRVDVMPKGPRDDAHPAHQENLGIMELGRTWDYPLPKRAELPDHRGWRV